MDTSNLFIKFSIFLFSFLVSALAFASGGGWVSSGGEIFKNAKNPWFVKNTTEVNYCVEFSEDEFSISKADATALIEASIKYWKLETDGKSSLDLQLPAGPQIPEYVAVGTQKFVMNSRCNGGNDIVFKFGYKTLDADEINHLKEPSKFLGVTIRKNYDEVNLKGSGVVFVSGDKGPNAYSGSSSEVLTQAWRYPKLLQYVIMHELGHVFGLPHSGSGVMSEVFLDQLLMKKIAALYVREPILPVIKSITSAEICADPVLPNGSQSFVGAFFGLSFKEDCLRIEMNNNRREFSLLTKKAAGPDAWKKIGTLFIDKNELTDFSLKPALMLQVSDKQSVFNLNFSAYLIGPVYQIYKVDGHINFGTSMKPISVQIDLSPDSLVIYGTHDSKIRQVFSFGSPFLYGMFKPF